MKTGQYLVSYTAKDYGNRSYASTGASGAEALTKFHAHMQRAKKYGCADYKVTALYELHPGTREVVARLDIPPGPNPHMATPPARRASFGETQTEQQTFAGMLVPNRPY